MFTASAISAIASWFLERYSSAGALMSLVPALSFKKAVNSIKRPFVEGRLQVGDCVLCPSLGTHRGHATVTEGIPIPEGFLSLFDDATLRGDRRIDLYRIRFSDGESTVVDRQFLFKVVAEEVGVEQ